MSQSHSIEFQPFPLPQVDWVPDCDASCCALCQREFKRSLLSSGKHHCRKWYETGYPSNIDTLCSFNNVLYGLLSMISGQVVCASCSTARVLSYRICDGCYIPGSSISDYIAKPLFHCDDTTKSTPSRSIISMEGSDGVHGQCHDLRHKMSDSTKSTKSSKSSDSSHSSRSTDCSRCKRYGHFCRLYIGNWRYIEVWCH